MRFGLRFEAKRSPTGKWFVFDNVEIRFVTGPLFDHDAVWQAKELNEAAGYEPENIEDANE